MIIFVLILEALIDTVLSGTLDIISWHCYEVGAFLAVLQWLLIIVLGRNRQGFFRNGSVFFLTIAVLKMLPRLIRLVTFFSYFGGWSFHEYVSAYFPLNTAILIAYNFIAAYMCWLFEKSSTKL